LDGESPNGPNQIQDGRDVRPVSRYMSEIGRDMVIVTMVEYIPKSCVLYRATWFSMTLDDSESHLNCSKCLWIKYRGNIAFGCYYFIISVYWILSLVIVIS